MFVDLRPAEQVRAVINLVSADRRHNITIFVSKGRLRYARRILASKFTVGGECSCSWKIECYMERTSLENGIKILEDGTEKNTNKTLLL